MANKVYYLDRDGATPQVVPANTDEKLKVYNSYEDIDTTKLVDGEVVSTKESAADGNNVYDYIDKQIADTQSNVKNYVDNHIAEAKDSILNSAQSYSTEDQLTGGYWIDGMPIHRQVFTGLSYGDGSGDWQITGITIKDVAQIVNFVGIRDSLKGLFYPTTVRMFGSSVEIYCTDSLTPRATGAIVEYTKTTD